ncbi:MAG: lipoprotein [Solirubrobacterales bacterium]|nr:lipoprotein [Solirubrobacterales bacterium]
MRRSISLAVLLAALAGCSHRFPSLPETGRPGSGIARNAPD